MINKHSYFYQLYYHWEAEHLRQERRLWTKIIHEKIINEISDKIWDQQCHCTFILTLCFQGNATWRFHVSTQMKNMMTHSIFSASNPIRSQNSKQIYGGNFWKCCFFKNIASHFLPWLYLYSVLLRKFHTTVFFFLQEPKIWKLRQQYDFCCFTSSKV